MHLALAAVLTLAILAVVEYLTHRLVMHHETVARGTYHRHAVQHHRLGRVDMNIDLPVWYALAMISPVLAGLTGCGRWREAAVAAAIAASYAVVWTGVHRAVHGVGGKWAERLPFYPALRAHHLAHHARPGRNFGGLFGPLLDRPLGTLYRAPK